MPMPDQVIDPYEASRIGPRLLAIGLLGAALLVGFGWYASTRAEREQNAAVAAAIPTSNERIFDDFQRSDGILGRDETATPVWNLVGPDLRLTNGQVESDGGQQTTIAVTDTGWADVSLGLVIPEPTVGSGLIFRYVDLHNHWSLIAVPEFATWNLVLTVDGEIAQSHATGLSGTEPGARLAVLAQGPEIQVFVNGLPAVRTVDPTFQTATVAGFIASPGAVATFDDFFAVEAATPGA